MLRREKPTSRLPNGAGLEPGLVSASRHPAAVTVSAPYPMRAAHCISKAYWHMAGRQSRLPLPRWLFLRYWVIQPISDAQQCADVVTKVVAVDDRHCQYQSLCLPSMCVPSATRGRRASRSEFGAKLSVTVLNGQGLASRGLSSMGHVS